MNKIVALWTHHRSLSTAFCMLTKQRSNLEIIIEPFKYMYYKDYYLKDEEVIKQYEDMKVFLTYEDVIHFPGTKKTTRYFIKKVAKSSMGIQQKLINLRALIQL